MKKQQRYRIAVGGLAFVTLAALVARLSSSNAGDGPTQAPWARDYQSYVGNQSLGARAIVRVFGTHPDFGRTVAGGPGAFVDIMANELSPGGQPTLLSTGHRVVDPAMDAAGRRIIRPRARASATSGATTRARVVCTTCWAVARHTVWRTLAPTSSTSRHCQRSGWCDC